VGNPKKPLVLLVFMRFGGYTRINSTAIWLKWKHAFCLIKSMIRLLNLETPSIRNFVNSALNRMLRHHRSDVTIRQWLRYVYGGEHPIATARFFCHDASKHLKCMKAIELMERPTEPFEVATSSGEAGSTLKIVGAYQEQVVALKPQLEFNPQERKQPAVSPVSIDPIAKRGSITVQALQKPSGQRYEGYRHWGLNE